MRRILIYFLHVFVLYEINSLYIVDTDLIPEIEYYIKKCPHVLRSDHRELRNS